MAKKIKINANMIIGYQKGEHRILKNGCVIIEGDKIIHVGRKYEGHVDLVIDASNRIISPGFINCHVHLDCFPLDKSYRAETESRPLYNSVLPLVLPARLAAMDEEGRKACVDYSMAELIRTGTTTFMEMGGLGDYVADAAERSGLRAYIGHMYRSANRFSPDGRRMEYEWQEEKGKRDFQQAIELIKRIDTRGNDRIKGFLSPAQVETCTEELLCMTQKTAKELDVPVALHASQSVDEVHVMMKRHGMTSIEWLESIGFLNERCILGHAIFTTGNSWIQFDGDDVGIMANHNVSISYCVWTKVRSSHILESFSSYQKAGVNICLGTDTCPQSMIEALRWTCVTGKIMSRNVKKPTAAEVFNAATLNAARLLKREDLGKIAPGAKADMLFWDTSSMFMVPLRDPIKNIVYDATPEDLKEVMINGKWVMKDKKVLNVNEGEVCHKLQIAAERMWPNIQRSNPAGLTVDEISPMSLKPFEEI